MSDLEIIKEWLRYAHNDLIVAKHCLENLYPKQTEIASYHCQQSAEKSLKAFLINKNIEPPKTHDLKLLCKMCQNSDSSFSVVLPPEKVVQEGTYKVKGNTVTITVVRVNTTMFGKDNKHGDSWFTYSALPAGYKGHMDTDTYVCTIENNTFTLVVSGGPMTFVKQ